MLSEGYLYRITYLCEDHFNSELYRERAAEEVTCEMRSMCGFKHSSTDEAQGKSIFQRCRSAGKFISSVHSKGSKHISKQKDNLPQPTSHPASEGQTPPAMDVCEGLTRKDAYLVPSSCKSICKNYNDLHIAGDYVMPISSVATDFTCDSGIGPFLESSEIPSPMESMRVPPSDISRKAAQGYSSCWRAASLVPHHQPLSDSALNDYLEQKLVELYKQYIMDSTVNRASPTQILASELIMTNVDQISMQISRERNMETTKAKDIVISRFLQIASEKISSEISTPSLHISQYSNTNA
ncbi:TLR adapter interacting with SLC15A4 on the lysosome [Struthio camelus]|uniref:TLR adapter interacting with SLC15A4 on the lysosome n=1 Tax=Struthio camelus TaxID=8801 RepID=UPI003603D441